jgi:endonuclease/exonuclease/phosphatase family metal-dependent hydrolase
LKKSISILGVLLILGCNDPFVTEFGDLEDAVMFEASNIPFILIPYNGGPLKVVTWNIRFGIARFPFFGDSCGDDVILDDATIEENMAAIADSLNVMDADIVLLQEVDVSSKRTGYMDQVQYLLDHTNLNYGCYASMWKADYIASDGIGRIDAGNAILSKYKLTDAERIQLRLRTDQDELTQYFYLRRNIVKAKIPALAQGAQDFYAVDIHATAFATDDTKQQHINKYVEVLGDIDANGDIFVTGGDLNSVPPGSKYDFCLEDMCVVEQYIDKDGNEMAYHSIDSLNNGPHKEGSYFNNFDNEKDLLVPLYDNYVPAIDTLSGANLDAGHFTHAPSTSNHFGPLVKYDRKLDYLFTNGIWDTGSGSTHQGAWELSDHMPVSALFMPAGNE